MKIIPSGGDIEIGMDLIANGIMLHMCPVLAESDREVVKVKLSATEARCLADALILFAQRRDKLDLPQIEEWQRGQRRGEVNAEAHHDA